MEWNYGDILDALQPQLPVDEPAFIHGARVITQGQTRIRSNNLARELIARGAKSGDKVAFYMRNRPEYMELLAACFKARLTHVNVNYRYKPDEVHYIFDNSDAQTVVYGSEFRETIEAIRDRLPKVMTFVEVSDNNDKASFAETYESLATKGNGDPLDIKRSAHDMLFIYTGGTTGMPKGVMWEHDAILAINRIVAARLGPVPDTPEAIVAAFAAAPMRMRSLPACPQMHGTGLLSSLSNMLSGGSIVTLTQANFDPDELWDTISRHKVNSTAIVGDAFAKPMLAALDANPGKYDLSSLLTITSSGVMWSREVKAGLIRHIPHVTLSDNFGSSEAIIMGSSVMTKDGETATAKFALSEVTKVFDENDEPVEPGSPKQGIVAIGGPIPLGYYKDPEKTAKTFRTIRGQRYSIPGDWCLVEADGTLNLLGRGSNCINTAGEKVYPEEVEEALKTHPSVADALVIGVPDDKWGQAVTGIVTLNPGSSFDPVVLREHVRHLLAGYKTPKHIIIGTVPFRAANGKADYKGVTAFAKRELGVA